MKSLSNRAVFLLSSQDSLCRGEVFRFFLPDSVPRTAVLSSKEVFDLFKLRGRLFDLMTWIARSIEMVVGKPGSYLVRACSVTFKNRNEPYTLVVLY